MKSLHNSQRELRVFWDSQDSENEGWYFRLTKCDENGDLTMLAEDSIDAGRDDLDGACDEVCRYLGIDATHDDFGTGTDDGGYGILTDDGSGILDQLEGGEV